MGLPSLPLTGHIAAAEVGGKVEVSLSNYGRTLVPGESGGEAELFDSSCFNFSRRFRSMSSVMVSEAKRTFWFG